MIQVNNVTKVFGTQKALDDVSFTIQPGEIVGLLGPNGAGKSTLMKIITCFIPPSDGEVLVCGHSIYDEPRQVCRCIGYLPEHNPLYTEMYIPEFLKFIAGTYGLRDSNKRVEEMIELTGLTPELGKKIGALSKGYRQRVGLAQALIHDPQVLILDEPTTGLDPNQLEEIRRVIRNVGQTKMVLLSTHIMQEVEAMCSRAIIINHGKIVADNSASELRVKELSSNRYTVEFDSEVEPSKLLRIAGVEKVRHLSGHSYLLLAHKDKDIREALFHWAVDNKRAVLTIRKEQESLEHVFQQLTLGGQSDSETTQ